MHAMMPMFMIDRWWNKLDSYTRIQTCLSAFLAHLHEDALFANSAVLDKTGPKRPPDVGGLGCHSSAS